MAIARIRADKLWRAYYDRKRAEGKTNREALRCLKRRLSAAVYRTSVWTSPVMCQRRVRAGMGGVKPAGR